MSQKKSNLIKIDENSKGIWRRLTKEDEKILEKYNKPDVEITIKTRWKDD